MDFAGLFLEIIFLLMGVYLYLFSRGKISTSDPERAKKAEAFRQKNASWLPYLSLALIAMMTINIFLHLQQLWTT